MECFVFLYLLLFASSFVKANEITGTIEAEEYLSQYPLIVQLFPLHTRSGSLQNLKKPQVYGIYNEKPLQQIHAISQPGVRDRYSFSFNRIPQGNYSVFAFFDTARTGKLSLEHGAPMGWYYSDGCISGGSLDLCTSPITLQGIGERVHVHFRVAGSHPFAPPDVDRVLAREDHGTLARMQGKTVMHLWGTPPQRGFAHGKLAARQIIDFFEYYILEERLRSHRFAYDRKVRPSLLQHIRPSPAFLVEARGIYAGMRASGQSLATSLGRDFELEDLMAINAYIDLGIGLRPTDGDNGVSAAEIQALRDRAGACTQIAFWGERTADGGTLVARNMDGEIDVRKVTTSHLVIFAVDPQTAHEQRYVHVIWPGFIAVLSGFNEAGTYSMFNCGCRRTHTTEPRDNSLLQDAMRELLLTTSNRTSGREVQRQLESHRGPGGGICPSGCVVFTAQPHVPGQRETPAFVYEGDAFGGAMRYPTETRPLAPNDIAASNHYFKYRVDDTMDPRTCNGHAYSYSSRWRYTVARAALEADDHHSTTVTRERVRTIMRSLTHAQTEHTILFDANRREFELANSNLRTDLWEAPYEPWASFHFDDVFV